MRIAIVEDEESATQELRVLFARYGKENNMEFSLDTFPDALKFLASYRADYDLVMLDIEMPFMNGMEGAEKLRKIDPYVPIVFVTNMRRYAVAGYKVKAIDFIIKPVTYYDFSTMLGRVRELAILKKDATISATFAGVMRNIPSSHIKYVEIYRHKLTFHTIAGDLESWGSLSDIEKQLPESSFFKCNNCFLVNLKYVDGIDKEDVLIGDDRLRISHLRKKDFVNALMRYLGRGGG